MNEVRRLCPVCLRWALVTPAGPLLRSGQRRPARFVDHLVEVSPRPTLRRDTPNELRRCPMGGEPVKSSLSPCLR